MSFPRICLALYRRLASAYPHEFRMLYGQDMERMGEDAVPQVWSRYGVLGIVRLLADIALRLPGTYLAEIRQDVAYASRVLLKSPGFASVAVVSVAIGIGMCSAVRSEFEGIVGPAAGLPDPAALVTFHWSTVSYPYFERYRDQPQTVASATALLRLVPFAVALTPDKTLRAARFYGHLVSPEYFSTLGVAPAAGRFFSPETEKPGMPPVVVVSDRFWRKQLGADRGAVGRTLRLNGRPATIVGIGPKDFLGVYPGNPADLFVPVTCGITLAPELSGDPLHDPEREIFRVVFRLTPGTTMAQAEAAMNAVTRNFDRERGLHPTHDRVMQLMPAGTALYSTPEQVRFTNTFHFVLWALVLALVCANLANLLLARGGERRREIAVRLSVGASRPRLVRQLLTESVLLSVTGGAIGAALGYGFMRVLSSLPSPLPLPVELQCRLDLRALAWTAAIAMVAGIGFGLAPALSCARTDIGRSLKEGAQAPLRGYGRFGLRNLFVACQMAASLMLVLVTGLAAGAFLLIARVNPGFEMANLSLVSLDPMRDGYSVSQAARLLEVLPDELSRVKEVDAASLSGVTPLAWISATETPARVSSSDSEGRSGPIIQAVRTERIGANYFATLGVPLLGGREFEPRDQRNTAEQGTPVPAILNQTAARSLFGSENPIGRRIREGETRYTVVGLARDGRPGFLRSKAAPTIFLPFTAAVFRADPAQGITVVLRGAAGHNTLAAVRGELASLHPDLTVFHARTLEEELNDWSSFIAWQSTIFVILGVFALLLACIGLGGVTAYAVARRRKEIGIRMALGARRSQVEGLVLREGAALVAVGSMLGFGGAFALWRLLTAYSDMLARTFDRPVSGPLLMLGAPLILALLTMLACYLPARRASRIAPVAALREE
ncbi:MAG TPA: ADOP family duplicated permease [Candidatus Acidoferrales bacterium]|nr:ADOP family duplicated permease [Candidatus Acidoferrales bacterium]